MNARGSTEVIVASIGLSSGAFTRSLFTMIVAMAMLTTMLMPVMLRRAVARLPIDRKEKERLEREDIDARGFVSPLERLLLAADASDAGRLASRLAGILAGARGMPTTLLALAAGAGIDEQTEPALRAKEPMEAVEEGAAAGAASAKAMPPEQRPRKADISLNTASDSLSEKLVRARRLGHDLMFVGMTGGLSQGGEFSAQLSRIVGEFEGPLAVVTTTDPPNERLFGARGRILVAINGTDTARRAAELACLLAPPLHASVTALYISNPGSRRSGALRRPLLRRNEESVLRDIVELAARYHADMRTAIRSSVSPEIPILREASQHDLLIMGVSRRPGEELFFGNTAAAVTQGWRGPTLFLAT